MVGVFVAFIRVVYGRMIYMSLPVRVASLGRVRSNSLTQQLRCYAASSLINHTTAECQLVYSLLP